MTTQTPVHDSVQLDIIAGKGGDGAISFRREAYAPKGGPDGGDGGKGGDIVFEGDRQLTTLIDLYRLKIIKAKSGQNGKGKNQTGASGDNLIVKIPTGSVVYHNNNINWRLIGEITKHDQKILMAKGGKGGFGNAHFATSTNQTPRFATLGSPGQIKKIKIVIKIIADVGLIGLPNVGKSTILSVICNAKPKIADYPFTTISPNLGFVTHHKKSFVVADIPGIIEGAHLGKGLGHQFLQHVERTKLLVHILSAKSQNISNDYQILRNELSMYHPKLLTKTEIIVINKIDLNQNLKYPNAILTSAIKSRGIQTLLNKIISNLN